MSKVWQVIKLFYYLMRISKNPQNTKAALAIAECLLKLDLVQEEVQCVRSTSEGRNAIEKREMLSSISLTDLQKKSEGTLGRAYSDRMLAENLQPDFYKVLEIEGDESYVMMRLRQTHDLWHTITGFGTSIPEELGLQAFMMAQVHSPLAPILIGSRLVISALKNPREARSIVDSVSRGWLMGNKAKPIFSLDWEKNWSTNLVELRTAYQI